MLKKLNHRVPMYLKSAVISNLEYILIQYFYTEIELDIDNDIDNILIHAHLSVNYVYITTKSKNIARGTTDPGY